MEDGIEGLRVPNLKEQILFSVTYSTRLFS